MKIRTIRDRYDGDRKRLNRARRLYARLLYNAFLDVSDNMMMRWFNGEVERAIRRGLWAMTAQTRRQREEDIVPAGALRSVRYALLRHWWRLDGTEKNWHVWYSNKGFACYSWEFIGTRNVKVVG